MRVIPITVICCLAAIFAMSGCGSSDTPSGRSPGSYQQSSYYLDIDGRTMGPYTWPQLQSMCLTAQQRIQEVGTQEWLLVKDIPGLIEIEEPPPAEPSEEQATSTAGDEQPRQQSSIKIGGIVAIIGGIATGLFVWAILFVPFFGDLDGFLTCVKYKIIPDLFSFFRGEYMKDWWHETKLQLWLLIGGGAGFFAFMGIAKLFQK